MMKRLLLLIVLLLSSSAWATPATIPKVKFEVVGPTAPFAPGPVTYQLIIYPSGQSGIVTVGVSDFKSVIYVGQNKFEMTYVDEQPLSLNVELYIPPNDTNSIAFSFDESAVEAGGRSSWHLSFASLYFAADESSVNVFDRDPRPFVEPPLPEKWQRLNDSIFAAQDSIKALKDSSRANYNPVWGDWKGPVVTYNDSDGNLVWDSVASAEMLNDPVQLHGEDFKRPWEIAAEKKARQEAREDSLKQVYDATHREALERAKERQGERQKEQRPERGGTPQEQMERFIRNHPIAEAVEESNWYDGNVAYDDNDENGFDHWWRWGATSTIGNDSFALWCAGYGGRFQCGRCPHRLRGTGQALSAPRNPPKGWATRRSRREAG